MGVIEVVIEQARSLDFSAGALTAGPLFLAWEY